MSTIGHAPRLGEFGYEKNDDAVEGVILMLRGEQTQNVLEGSGSKDRGIEPDDPAAGRQNPSLLRSQRTGKADHRYRGSQSAPRHGTGADRPDVLSGQLSGSHYRGAHDSAVAVVRFYRVTRPRWGGQPALDWRHRFRDHHRWHGGDGGEYLPRAGLAARRELQAARSHSHWRRKMSIGPSSIRSQLSWRAIFPSTLSAALRESYSIPWPRLCRLPW